MCEAPPTNRPPELTQVEASPENPFAAYVRIPAALDSNQRFARFDEPLDSALQWVGVGVVSGGGTMHSGPPDDESREVVYCGIEVDLFDAARGIEVLLEELRHLGAPPGSTVEFASGGEEFSITVWPEETQSR